MPGNPNKLLKFLIASSVILLHGCYVEKEIPDRDLNI